MTDKDVLRILNEEHKREFVHVKRITGDDYRPGKPKEGFVVDYIEDDISLRKYFTNEDDARDFVENELNAKFKLDKFYESINEDWSAEDATEEMHKERYVTYFETQEGRQRYTIYHVYTDSTDDSYNELCDKRDNQLGMYNSYKELKDALKERAEKIAKQQGWTVKSIENLGEDDDYYRERNKLESLNLDKITDKEAKEVAQYLNDFVTDKQNKYYYIDKAEAILNKYDDKK